MISISVVSHHEKLKEPNDRKVAISDSLAENIDEEVEEHKEDD
jgi:hypothetical protein